MVCVYFVGAMGEKDVMFKVIFCGMSLGSSYGQERIEYIHLPIIPGYVNVNVS